MVKADQLFDYTDIFDENMTISADFSPKNAADTKCCYLLHLEYESCICYHGRFKMHKKQNDHYSAASKPVFACFN